MFMSKLSGTTCLAVVLVAVAAVAAAASPAVSGSVAGGTGAAASAVRNGPVPAGRVWASWAYDPAQRDVVLFGGDTGYQSGADTVTGRMWTWNGRTWTRRQPKVHPSPRTGAAIVWDGATRQLLLFGGSRLPFTGGGFLADTWAWNGRSWTRLHPAVSPPARHNADLVYDTTRHQVILFGGYNGRYLGDTWTWNGRTWTQLHPATAPLPRDTHSLVYDPATRTTILFGGFNGQLLGDTWSWNGTTWTQLHPPAAPGPRAYGSLTYDQKLHRLILFAGSTGNFDPATVWEWNGTTWSR